MLISFPILFSYSQNTEITLLSSHWVPRWGFRDELNASDIDHQNFWSDNAGKILTMAELTGDSVDASRALWFIQNYARGDYLPEAVVNSSLLDSNNMTTNRIAMLNVANGSDLQSLSVGNYYAGEQTLAYIGSDRILVGGTIYRSSSSVVFRTLQNEFVKRSLFNTSVGYLYTYLNATINVGAPYVTVSLQVLPEKHNMSQSDVLYLQAFTTPSQLTNASLYDSNGSYVRPLRLNNGSPSSQNGMIIAYSKNNVFSQDAIGVSFSNKTAQVNDFELWQKDGAFDGYSWTGVAFNAPQDSAGSLSIPIYAKIYPIEHMDYRLINDTARYIMLNVNDTTVSPPVSFGFDAYGLALASLNNASLQSFAKSYWNFYYSRYSTLRDYPTAYARSIDVFALAGFTLYGCNSTVESFTRSYLGNSSGASIEENGWAAAALYRLQSCTRLPTDLALYKSAVNSIEIGGPKYVSPVKPNAPIPNDTFQFAEAASGLMLGGVSYNDPVVIALMNPVFQSNVNGTILNQPNHGDLANTETLPAYMLSTWLFENEMSNQTGGYSITGLRGVNLTSVMNLNGSVFVQGYGNNGTIYFSSPQGDQNQVNIDGLSAASLSPIPVSSTTTTVTATTTLTTTARVSSIVTTTTTTTVTSSSDPWPQILLIVSTIFVIAGAVAFAVAMRKRGR